MVGSGSDRVGARVQVLDRVRPRLGVVSREQLTLGEFGETEIQHLHQAVVPQHDVLGFDVAVRDAGAVGGHERAADLHRNFDRFCNRQSSTGQMLSQRLPSDEFHRDEVGFAGFGPHLTDLVDCQDVRMVERANRARLLLEAAHALSILCESGRQELESDGAAEGHIFSQVDLTHAARAQLGNDSIP